MAPVTCPGCSEISRSERVRPNRPQPVGKSLLSLVQILLAPETQQKAIRFPAVRPELHARDGVEQLVHIAERDTGLGGISRYRLVFRYQIVDDRR